MWKSWSLAQKYSRAVRFVPLFLLGFCALHGILLWRLREKIAQGYGDFAAFYTAGRMVDSGSSAKLYDRASQWKVQQEFASQVNTRRGPLPYIRPPFEALVFAPAGRMQYGAAWLVWFSLKIALLALVTWVAPISCTAAMSFRDRLLVGGAFFPVGFDLVQGQDSILLLLIFAGAARLLAQESYFLCGLVLALGLFKPHLVIPFFLVLAVQRRGLKIAGGFVAAAIPLLMISISMVHWRGIVEYPRYLWFLNQAPELGMVKAASMPNIRGLAAALLPGISSTRFVSWLLFAVVGAGIFVAARAWSTFVQSSVLIAFSFVIVMVLVTSYYANSYDLTLLLLPLWFIGEPLLTGEIGGRGRSLFLTTAALLLCAPLLWFLVFAVDAFALVAAVLLIGFAISVFEIGRSWRGRVQSGIVASS